MRLRLRQVWAALLLLSMLAPAVASERSTAAKLYNRFDAASFRAYAPAKQQINPENYDTNLLAAAVFHETNRRRAQQELPPLRHLAALDRAAAIQSSIMSKRGTISHHNPNEPKFAKMLDRVSAVGLRPAFAAENVATAFAIRYESGDPYYERVESGRTVLSSSPGGKPIPAHTYISFAERLLDQWMQSPGHRENILHRSPKLLGTSCLPAARSDGSMTQFYCTQVFFTPLD